MVSCAARLECKANSNFPFIGLGEIRNDTIKSLVKNFIGTNTFVSFIHFSFSADNLMTGL